MFFKTDAERAAAQAAKARQDAGEAGASAASGARNLGAAALATLAEVTAPKDDKSGKRHAQRARAKAMRAAGKDRDSAAKAAGKARERGRSAADHGKKELSRRREKAAQEAGQLAEDARAQGAYAAGVLRDRSSDAAQTVKAKAAPLGERAGEKAGAGAALMGSLAAAARARAADTRDRAVSGMDHGIDAAVPRAQEGVAAVGPKVDHLRDVINDELLPKIQAMLGDVQTGKDRVLTQDQGIAAAVTGAPKKRSKKGGVLIALGLLAAVGAGVAWWLAQQQKAPATDPWATPTTASDPWASTAPTSVGASAADDAVVADSSPVAGSSAAVTDAGGGTADISTDGAGDGVSSGGPVENPRMLDSEEIDDLGTETPSPIAEQGEGESPTEEIEAARAQEGAPIGDDTSTADGDRDEPRA